MHTSEPKKDFFAKTTNLDVDALFANISLKSQTIQGKYEQF